jgi:hypothetical protein
MDDNKLDVLAYPVTRQIAPLLGGNQQGSNAGVSAHSGLPAISIPAGFTPGGFPVGMELLGRAFAESMLISLAYSFEQATHHRRPPHTTPAALPPPGGAPEPSADTGPNSITGTARATGANASPATDVPFEAQIAWSFNEGTRQFGYDISVSGTSEDVDGAYLHLRLGEGPRGGVAHVLSKMGGPHIVGQKTLTTAEADALKAGKMYISLLSAETPLRGARADVVWPTEASPLAQLTSVRDPGDDLLGDHLQILDSGFRCGRQAIDGQPDSIEPEFVACIEQFFHTVPWRTVDCPLVQGYLRAELQLRHIGFLHGPRPVHIEGLIEVLLRGHACLFFRSPNHQTA